MDPPGYDKDGLVLPGEDAHSWRGMAAPDTLRGISPLSDGLPRAYWWFDWTSDRAGRVLVHRDAIVLADGAHDAIRKADQAMRSAVQELVASWDSSPYDAINARIAGMPLTPRTRLVFPIANGGARSLEDITFPWVECHFQQTGAEPAVRWRGQPVQIVDRFRLHGSASEELRLGGNGLQPTHLTLTGREGGEMAMLVYATDTRSVIRQQGLWEVVFPSAWADVVVLRLGASVNDVDIFNQDHPLVALLRTATDEDPQALQSQRRSSSDEAIARASSSPVRAAAWLAQIWLEMESDLWAAVHERHPEIVRSVIDALPGGHALFPLRIVRSYIGFTAAFVVEADGTSNLEYVDSPSDADFVLEPDAGE